MPFFIGKNMTTKPEEVIQRNILFLEFFAPKTFKDEVYYLINTYLNISLESIYSIMKAAVKQVDQKQLAPTTEVLEQLYQTKNIEDLILIAKINASATAIALKATQIPRSLDWWIHITRQMIDVSNPPSQTKH
jgi:hypothetical protein